MAQGHFNFDLIYSILNNISCSIQAPGDMVNEGEVVQFVLARCLLSIPDTFHLSNRLSQIYLLNLSMLKLFLNIRGFSPKFL